MPSQARLNRVRKQLAPKKGTRWVYVGHYDEAGEEVAPWDGPDGPIEGEPPPDARRLVVQFTTRWRGEHKVQRWEGVHVDVDLYDAAPLPRPVPDRILDNGEPEPVPVLVRAPDAWIVAKPSAAEVAKFVMGQAWLWGADRRRAGEEAVSDMVLPVTGGQLPADVIVVSGPFDSKAAALASASELLQGMQAAYVDSHRDD